MQCGLKTALHLLVGSDPIRVTPHLHGRLLPVAMVDSRCAGSWRVTERAAGLDLLTLSDPYLLFDHRQCSYQERALQSWCARPYTLHLHRVP
jgi:hypothetical protein